MGYKLRNIFFPDVLSGKYKSSFRLCFECQIESVKLLSVNIYLKT
jgi:hypothetical protein